MRASSSGTGSLLPTTTTHSGNVGGGGGVNSVMPEEKSTSTTSSSNTTSALFNTSSAASFKMILLIMMVLQNSATVLVGRYTRTSVPNKEDLYDVNHLIVVIELGKLLLSCLFEFYHTNGNFIQSIRIYILDHPVDTIKILIPALLYLVQNTLLYVALSNLTAPIFQVTYQAKLVTTAIVSVFLLRRSYSVQQWVCLVLLSLGVAIVVLGEQSKSTSASSSSSGSSNSHSASRQLLEDIASVTAPAQSLLVGLSAVTVACFSSALAGVYFEMVLKVPNANDATKHPPASLWMRNIQLSFFSIVIALAQGMMKGTSSSSPATKSYLHGFTAWVWILVLLQAGGGLLVAAVIKYADNVLKGLATGVSVVFATVLSMILFGTPLSNQFIFGATMILAAVYYFSNPLPATMNNLFASINGTGSGNGKDKSERQDNIETKNLLPK